MGGGRGKANLPRAAGVSTPAGSLQEGANVDSWRGEQCDESSGLLRLTWHQYVSWGWIAAKQIQIG